MERKFLTLFFFLLVGISTFLGWHLTEYPQTNSETIYKLSKGDNSVYDRVMRSQTLRCGYGPWPPFINKDPLTGQFSGIFFDYMEALGKSLHLKILWTEEVGNGEFIEALKSGRIDAMCASIWPSASRAREIDFVTPIYYSPIYAYSRIHDTRFDHHLDRINAPDISLVTVDGEIGDIIANEDYPKVRKISLPQSSSVSEAFMTLASRKADVVFANPAMFALYEAKNPRIVQRIPANHPLRVFGNTIAITAGEDKLRQMLSTATVELLASGKIDSILNQYKPDSDSLLRVRPFFQDRQ